VEGFCRCGAIPEIDEEDTWNDAVFDVYPEQFVQECTGP
jgi:hypothetical protein